MYRDLKTPDFWSLQYAQKVLNMDLLKQWDTGYPIVQKVICLKNTESFKDSNKAKWLGIEDCCDKRHNES